MNKLERAGRSRNRSRKNHRRFFTSRDMSILKHDAAIHNAKVNRGEVKKIGWTEEKALKGHGFGGITPCGCGREGCFIHYEI